MNNSAQLPLEPNLWPTLLAVVRTLIPATAKLPDGETAGVAIYLATALTDHHSRHVPAYTSFLNELNKLSMQYEGKRFELLDGVSAEKVLMEAERRMNADFLKVRNHSFEGYFAHPRWRNGLGGEIWNAVGFRPVLRPSDQFSPGES